MKRFNLISILILFFSFFGVQCVVGQTTKNEKYQHIDGVYYTAYITDKYDIYYSTTMNSEGKDGIFAGNIITKKNYTINFEYPASSLSFDAQTEYNKKTQIRIKYKKNDTWERWWTTDNINTQTRTGSLLGGYKYHDNYGTYKSSDKNIVNIPDPKNCRSIEFEKNTYYSDYFNVNIKNVRLRMAPHTRLTQDGSTAITNHNNITTETFSTTFNVPKNDTDSRTIKFYSCLTGSNGLTASIVESNTESATPTDLNGQVKLYHTGLGEKTLTVGANEFVAINTGAWNFDIKFTPTEIITKKTVYIRIKNEGAVDNSIIYIPVVLNSSLKDPANFECTEYGYSYIKLKWDAVSNATYNLYDNDSLIQKNIPTTTTSYEIGYLTPGSTHNYTIKSCYNGSESAGKTVTVKLTQFPTLQSVTIPAENVTQNSLIINWSKGVSKHESQPIINYHIHLYQHDYDKDTAYYKGYYIVNGADITTYTLDKLIDDTEYTIYVGPEFVDPIARKGIYPIAGSDWRSTTTRTKSFLPSSDKLYNDILEYRGVWYRVFLYENRRINNGGSVEEKDDPLIMDLWYPCESKVDFKINTSEVIGIYGTANIKVDETTSGDFNDKTTIDAGSFNGINDPGTIHTSGHNVKALKFYSDGGNNINEYIHDIWLTIAPHIKFNTPTEYDFGEVELDQTPSFAVDFKSFLVSQEGKLIVESNNPAFKINGISESKDLAEGNTLEKLDENNYNFDISFVGNKLGETGDAHITIRDVISDKNGNDSVIVNIETITVRGTRVKKTPIITWIDSKIIKVEEYVENAASSTCGTEIAYTSTDPSVIKVEGGKLIALTEGTANIIATTKGNNIYKSISDTVEFTTTNKKIQIIDWNQNFYLLTLNSSDMELTAKSLDRDTKEETGDTITYSSENTNVVTISNGVLHVVGAGQTTIIAEQIGTDDYAPAIMKKYVVVRNAIDGDCSGEPALNAPNKVGKGDESILQDGGGWDWSPLEIEHELTTVGEYLSFVVECSSISTEYIGDVGGARLIVTDQDGEEIYNGKGNNQSPEPILLNRSVRKLKFQLTANLIKSISQIAVTPAIYLEANKTEIVFNTPTQVANTTTLDDIVTIDWANQPDVIWTSITDIKLNGEDIAENEMTQTPVFAVTKNALIGGLCGNFGSTPLSVAFTPIKAGNYTAKLIVSVGENTEAKITIDIKATAIAVEQSLIWEDFNLTTADKNITITDVLCQSTKYNLLNLLGETITYTSSNHNIIEINGDTLSVLKYGEEVTITATQAGKEGYINPATSTKTITPSIGTITFDTNGDWNTVANWLPVNCLNMQRNVEPSAMVNAKIEAEATISNSNCEINDLTIEANGKLTISATSALKANKITNENADKLILKASTEGNNATLIHTYVYTDDTPAPKATVEMYSKAENGTLDHTDGKSPQWQYVGVAVKRATVGNFRYNDERTAWLLKWDETRLDTTDNPWGDSPLGDETEIAPWAGYAISQPKATTYSISGTLMNGNHEYKLSYTPSDDPDCGFNLLANSYTAPIDITQLEFSDTVDACIVLYNTGTYADWESQQGKLSKENLNNPGQLIVIPKETSSVIGLPTTIASMQAFFVIAKADGATLKVDYKTAVAGATNHGNQMRAPEAHDEFNVLKIMIEGENSRDRLWLLENEKTTRAYDNGYEARKIFDAPCGHQMYATCQYGYASIDCSESMIGQTIGLKGDNEGELLTISFDTSKLKYYQSLYLYDKATGKYVNITAGEEYTFYGVKGADDNRFSIVTNPDDKMQTPPFVVIDNTLCFDKSQIDSDNANIYIYDTSGRLLMTERVNPYESYNIPDMPNGIYLVSMNGYTTKIVKK